MKVKVNAEGQQVADDDPTAVGEIEVADPTPAPPQPNHTEVLNAYQQQLLEQARENKRLRDELEASRRQPPAPPSPEEEKQFFDAPRTATTEIVRRELENQVKPINDFVRQMQRDQAYAGLKQQMRANPAQFAYLAQVENYLDQIMQQAQVVDANTVIAAYNTALGYYISQGGSLTPSTPEPSRSNNVPVPPNPRPAPPLTPPSPRNTRTKPQLTANEQKIARFNGQTDEEYIFWRDGVRPDEVAHLTDEQIKERIGK